MPFRKKKNMAVLYITVKCITLYNDISLSIHLQHILAAQPNLFYGFTMLKRVINK